MQSNAVHSLKSALWDERSVAVSRLVSAGLRLVACITWSFLSYVVTSQSRDFFRELLYFWYLCTFRI